MLWAYFSLHQTTVFVGEGCKLFFTLEVQGILANPLYHLQQFANPYYFL